MEIKAYSAIQRYSTENKEVDKSAKTTTPTSDTSSTTASEESSQGDKLTISDSGKLARLKEMLGYDGRNTKITRQDILNRAETAQTSLETKLASLCKELGIAEGSKLSISTDSSGKFTVSGAGTQNKALADKLNGDEAFTQSYIRLEANQRFIDLPAEIMDSSRKSLVDYLGGSNNQLFEQQLNTYACYQKAPDSFTAMLMISSMSTNSFSFDYSV